MADASIKVADLQARRGAQPVDGGARGLRRRQVQGVPEVLQGRLGRVAHASLAAGRLGARRRRAVAAVLLAHEALEVLLGQEAPGELRGHRCVCLAPAGASGAAVWRRAEIERAASGCPPS